MLFSSFRALRWLRYCMYEGLVKATVRASIAWWRWSLRFVQSLITVTLLPSLRSSTSVSPNDWYLGIFSSFITSTKPQSSRNLSVILPEVDSTFLVTWKSISLAFLAMYWVSLRSLLIKPSPISEAFLSKFLYLVSEMLFVL